MILALFLNFVVTFLVAEAGNLPANSRCSTKEVSSTDQFQQRRALSLYEQVPGSARADLITVPVCFFVLTPTSQAWDLTNEDLQAQLDHLNQAFTDSSCCDHTTEGWCTPNTCSIETGIQFAMAIVDQDGEVTEGNSTVASVSEQGACVVRIEDDSYARTYNYIGADISMKRALRKGGPGVLNIYFLEFIDKTLGYATFPWDATGNDLGIDGLVIDYTTLPGLGRAKYGEGDTLVHEVGHWLGLFHTFESGCSDGDGIADTPPEKYAYYGCNPASSRDTCGTNEPRPIHNYLNYADDACMYRFTQGQKKVMRACWDIFRLENGVPIRATIPLAIGNTSDPLFLAPFETQVYSLNITGLQGNISCTSTGPEGDIVMHMSVDTPPAFDWVSDCCRSDDSFVREICRAGPMLTDENTTRERRRRLLCIQREFHFPFRFLNWFFNRCKQKKESDDDEPTAEPTEEPFPEEVAISCYTDGGTALYVGIVASEPGKSVQEARITCTEQ